MFPERSRIEEIYDDLANAKRDAGIALIECCRTFVAFSPIYDNARESLANIKRPAPSRRIRP